MKIIKSAVCLATSLILTVGGARAATVYGVTDAGNFVRFQSGSPGTFTTNTPITGLDAGYAIVGMDMRTTTQTSGAANPGVGTLWALATDGTDYRLYTINWSGAATARGGVLSAMNGAVAGQTNWGFAFNPGKDRFSAVGVYQNFEINPNTLTAVRLTDVSGGGNMNPAFSGATFSVVPFGVQARFYIADTGADRLASIANLSAGGDIGFNGSAQDFGAGLNGGGPNSIDTADGLTLFANSNSNLYALNLSTGVATMIGTFPGAAQLRGMAIMPTSFPGAASVTVAVKGKKKITTTATSLKIKGTATSEAGVTSVKYKIGKKAFKTASGTTNWNFKAKLKPGVNTIQVQAIGSNGASSPIVKIKVKVVTAL